MTTDRWTALDDAGTAAAWRDAGLPAPVLARIACSGHDPVLPSSFAVARAAALSIAAAAGAAAAFGAARGGTVQPLTVDLRHAAVECTGWFSVDGQTPDPWDPIAGLYPCADAEGIERGWLRIHTNFAHHRDIALGVLGLPPGADRTRAQVAEAIAAHTSFDLEAAIMQAGGVATALRSLEVWSAHPQAAAVASEPLVAIERIGEAPARRDPALPPSTAPLHGVRVLEMTRILAGPVAGRTLATHGADVLLVNAPHLPNIDALADTSRGKRSALADLRDPDDRERLLGVLRAADVLLTSYRPHSLDRHGLGATELAATHPGLVIASLSAWGRRGPWADRRGFDSLVQTATGFNVDEARALGSARPQPMPMQILDMAAGHWLAFGVAAALHRQRAAGGTWAVHVSLARVGQWLRSLGRVAEGGAVDGSMSSRDDVLTAADSGWGRLVAVRHAGLLPGAAVAASRPSARPGTHPLAW